MQQHMKTSLCGMALMAALLALPSSLAAQQPAQQEACTARVSPTQVAAGQEAAQVTITVSRAIGNVAAIDGGESGITVAEPSALPRTPLAGPDSPPTPIRMGDSESQWIVYLNTTEAAAGTHELTFQSERGACTGQIAVAAAPR